MLRSGGSALIIDMRNDASSKSIVAEVTKMHLGRIDAFLTRTTLSALRRRAFSRLEFERMAQAMEFGRCHIVEQPLGFEVTLGQVTPPVVGCWMAQPLKFRSGSQRRRPNARWRGEAIVWCGTSAIAHPKLMQRCAWSD